MRPSSRVPHDAATNALTDALARARTAGIPLDDLSESNPTRVGLSYPADLLRGLSDPAALRYDPEPLGLRSAREAVAADAARRSARVDAEHVVLSASTSEAYAWIFKLLCDPGDVVLVPRPSYPLFEYLARAEGVQLHPYDLRFHGRWEIDAASLDAAPPRTRVVVAVSPNNPTGSFLRQRDVDALFGACTRHGWALVVDEVFADYPLDVDAPLTDIATQAPVLTFSLGGASKSLGLPQVKLGWTVVGGPAEDRRAALDGLAHIADTYLSVGTPVQVAAMDIFERGAGVRSAIQARVRENLGSARTIVAAIPSCTVLPVEGGWTAVVRVPALRSEETLVVELLERERVLVHPGYFFDFDHEAFLVVSLLPEPAVFAGAFERALRYASTVP